MPSGRGLYKVFRYLDDKALSFEEQRDGGTLDLGDVRTGERAIETSDQLRV